MDLKATLRHPRTRTGVRVAAVVVAVWAVVGFLVLPHFLRPVVERKLAESLHRPVKLRGLSLNPFTLSVTLDGLDVRDKGGSVPFFSFARLLLNFEIASIFRGGPVIRALTLSKPAVTVVRNEDRTYNFQDLLDEAMKPKPPKPGQKDKPLRFSVNNIRIEGGNVDFDDRPGKTKHEVRNLNIGIPFISNIPSKVEITTRPLLEARVNGTPFSLEGTAKPFSQTHEMSLDIKLADLDLPYYFAYAPPSIPWKLKSGRLDVDVTVAFAQPPGGVPSLVLSGSSALRQFAAEKDGRPLMALERLELDLDSADAFRRKVRVQSVKVVRPEAWVRREKLGEHKIAEAFIAPAAPSGKKAGGQAREEPEAAGAPMLVQIGEIRVEGGKVHYDDLSFARPFQTLIGDLAVSVKNFSTAPGKAAAFEMSAKTDAGETIRNVGTVTMEPLVVQGRVELTGMPLKRYAPFYEAQVRFDVDDGVLDLATRYRYSTGAEANSILSELAAALKSPRLRKRDEKKPFFEAPALTVSGASLDLGKHDVVVGEIATAGGVLSVTRDKEGNADLAKLAAEAPPGAPAQASTAAAAPWNVALRKLSLETYTVHIQDFAPDRPAKYALTKLGVLLENVSMARDAKGALSVRFGINGRGSASAKGDVGIHPTFASLDADVRDLDLVPLAPYVLSSFKVTLARALLSARGKLSLSESVPGKTSIVYSGKALIRDLLTVDPATKLDFFKWDAFSLEGLKAGYAPTFLEVGRLAVNGVAFDLVVEEDGTVNLSKVVGKKPASEEASEAEEEEAPAPSASASAAPPAAAPVTPAAPSTEESPATAGKAQIQSASASASPPAAATPAAQAAGTDDKVPIRIDELTLQGGRIGYADHFIKPNFAATLGNLGGRITGLSTEMGTVAKLDLKGSLANHSPLEISGSVNPLAATAFADVTASFRGIDLPPFTPYSGKYAGYAIGRGTLTLELHYKLQNRKLAAENKILADQFEFGEKVESKDATKLPVRLAVSLLKDRNGLIDVDLPIEGSLDDPKFRLGKLIWKLLGNLIGKAATAPFALLGKLVGGGKSEELSSVDFADGSETLDDAAKKKLDALGKALNDRPALKLEATGRVSGDKDAEGLRHLLFDRKLKAQKLVVLSKSGEAPGSVDAVEVSAEEYPTYLEKAYKKEKFKKPSNFLGIAKDIPSAEMESLMLANLAVTDDDLRQLALARANAVKDYLTGSAKVEATRVFVLEPAVKPAQSTATARGSRVDFALK